MKKRWAFLALSLILSGALSVYTKDLSPLAQMVFTEESPSTKTSAEKPEWEPPPVSKNLHPQSSEPHQDLANFIHTEAAQMDKLHAHPELIEQKIQNIADSLSWQDSLFLASLCKDQKQPHNQRLLAADLLTRSPQRFTDALLEILARDVDLKPYQEMTHVFEDVMVSFESALSVQVLQRLEMLALQDKNTLNALEDILRNPDLASETKDQVYKSVQAAHQGEAYWTKKSLELLKGVTL